MDQVKSGRGNPQDRGLQLPRYMDKQQSPRPVYVHGAASGAKRPPAANTQGQAGNAPRQQPRASTQPPATTSNGARRSAPTTQVYTGNATRQQPASAASTQRQPAGTTRRPPASASAPKKTGGNGGNPRSGSALTTQRGSAGQASTRRTSSNGNPPKGTNGTPQKRKKKPNNSNRLLKVALGVFACLVCVVGAILLLNRNQPAGSLTEMLESDATFREGISLVVGSKTIDISGKDAAQAKLLADAEVAALKGKISVTMQHDGNTWSFTAADMNLTSDLEDVLVDAMNFGSDGSMSENSDARELLKTEGKAFPVAFAADTVALARKLSGFAEEVNRPVIEPYAIPELNADNTPVFTYMSGENGLVLNAEATAQKIADCVAAGKFTDTIAPSFNETPPTLSLDFIKANHELIATCQTRYSNSKEPPIPNRVFNIQKTADILNCHVVQDGEEFSFNGLVGMRNKANGWKEANGISGGKEMTLQYGGGICQASTTLYNALLLGNINITDRRAHSIPSTYVDKGLDATVDSRGIDLKFLNDTGAPIYIFAYITKDPESSRRLLINVSLYGKPLPAGVSYKVFSEVIEIIPRTEIKYIDSKTLPIGYQMLSVEPHDGFRAIAYRTKLVNGVKEGESEKLYEDKYNGNNAEWLRGTGDRATTPLIEGATLMEGFDPIPGTEPAAEVPEEDAPESAA